MVYSGYGLFTFADGIIVQGIVLLQISIIHETAPRKVIQANFCSLFLQNSA